MNCFMQALRNLCNAKNRLQRIQNVIDSTSCVQQKSALNKRFADWMLRLNYSCRSKSIIECLHVEANHVFRKYRQLLHNLTGRIFSFVSKCVVCFSLIIRFRMPTTSTPTQATLVVERAPTSPKLGYSKANYHGNK